MCHMIEVSRAQSRAFNNQPVDQFLNRSLLAAASPHRVRPGHCLICGTRMTPEHMFPHRRTPRSMCKRCYSIMIDQAREGTCIPWGQKLHKKQAKVWRKRPREISTGFCNGDCFDNWIMLNGIVLGVEYNIPHQLPQPPADNIIQLPCQQRAHVHEVFPRLQQALPPAQQFHTLQLPESQVIHPVEAHSGQQSIGQRMTVVFRQITTRIISRY